MFYSILFCVMKKHDSKTRDIRVRSYYGVPGIVMFQDDLRLDHPEVFLDPLVGNSQI